MRTRKIDYAEVSRQSIKRDFRQTTTRAAAVQHQDNDVKRVISLSDNSAYAQYKRFIVGKLVRIVSKGENGCWVRFVNDSDAQVLNGIAGWSDAKRDYLLDGAKFD